RGSLYGDGEGLAGGTLHTNGRERTRSELNARMLASATWALHKGLYRLCGGVCQAECGGDSRRGAAAEGRFCVCFSVAKENKSHTQLTTRPARDEPTTGTPQACRRGEGGTPAGRRPP